MTTAAQPTASLQAVRSAEFAEAKAVLLGAGLRPPILLRGETGSGKSVLLARLVNAALGDGWRVRPLSELTAAGSGDDTWEPAAATLYVGDDVDQVGWPAPTIAHLASPRVRVLVSASGPSVFDRSTQVVTLGPLDTTAARALARDEAPGAPPTAIDHIVAMAEGSLALLTAGAACLRADWAAALRRPTLQVPDQYAPMVDAFLSLAATTQHVLATAAVRRGAVATPSDPETEAFLVSSGVGTSRFRSAIHRAVVLAASSPAQYRGAHRAARESVVQGHERIRHAAFGADDGGASLSQWAYAVAAEPAGLRISAQLQAADLATGTEARRRLGVAIAGAALSGDLLLVQQLLADHRTDVNADPHAMIGAALLRALVHGDADGAQRLLRAAFAMVPPAQTEPFLVAMAAVNVLTVNETTVWSEWSDLAAPHPSPLMARLRDAVRRSAGATDSAGASQVVEGPLARRAPAEDLAETMVGAICPELSWRSVDRATRHDDRSMDRSRIGHTLSVLVEATRLVREHRGESALALLDIATREAVISGNRSSALGADAMRSLVLAMTGETDAASSLARRVLSDPLAALLPRIAVTARHTLLHLAVQQGDEDGTFAALTSAEHFAFDGGAYPALWMLDLADALDYPGLPAEVLARKHDLVPPQIRKHSPGERIAHEYLRLRSGTGPQLVALRRLLTSAKISGFQYEAGRVRLAYGTALARTGDLASAGAAFTSAQETFEALGVTAWAGRAATLREQFLGQALLEPQVEDLPGFSDLPVIVVPLTEQELRVAALAAAGLSNKQIAERLTVSPRTVGGHLYNIFPKLGVRSRAGLRDALNRHGQRPSALVPAS